MAKYNPAAAEQYMAVFERRRSIEQGALENELKAS